MAPCCAGSECQEPMNPFMRFKCYSCQQFLHSPLCCARVFCLDGKIQHCCFGCEQDWIKKERLRSPANQVKIPDGLWMAERMDIPTSPVMAISPTASAVSPSEGSHSPPIDGHRYPTRISEQCRKPKQTMASSKPQLVKQSMLRRNKRRKVRDINANPTGSRCSTPSSVSSKQS